MTDNCKTCHYWRPSASGDPKSIKCCHYYLDTGRQKGYQVGRCKVYRPRAEKRRNP